MAAISRLQGRARDEFVWYLYQLGPYPMRDTESAKEEIMQDARRLRLRKAIYRSR